MIDARLFELPMSDHVFEEVYLAQGQVPSRAPTGTGGAMPVSQPGRAGSATMGRADSSGPGRKKSGGIFSFYH